MVCEDEVEVGILHLHCWKGKEGVNGAFMIGELGM